MIDSLSKPDDTRQLAHKKEVKARLLMRCIRIVYAAAGLLTLFFYLSRSLSQCGGFLGCGAALLKASVWTLLWPFYWMFYTSGIT